MGLYVIFCQKKYAIVKKRNHGGVPMTLNDQ